LAASECFILIADVFIANDIDILFTLCEPPVRHALKIEKLQAVRMHEIWQDTAETYNDREK
jgi:hypothetical protein